MTLTYAGLKDWVRVSLTLTVPPVVAAAGAALFVGASAGSLPSLPVFVGIVLFMTALLAAAGLIIPRIGGQE